MGHGYAWSMTTSTKMTATTDDKLQVSAALGPADSTWSKYGLTERALYVKDVDGKEYDTGRKWVLRGGDKMVADVSQKYTLMPNEEVLSLLEAAGFKPQKVFYSGHPKGNIMHAELLTDKQAEVKVGDVIRLGVMFRNSIDGSTGFGGDLFNMRLRCSNGAVARGEDLATFSHRHVGERDTIVEGIKKAVRRLLQASEELVLTYRRAAEIRLNEEFARLLVKNIPERYLPDYIDTKGTGKRLSATPDLFTTFNDITEKLWHSDRPSMSTKSDHEVNLHKMLVAATTTVSA